jgi:hypothetical protein
MNIFINEHSIGEYMSFKYISFDRPFLESSLAVRLTQVVRDTLCVFEVLLLGVASTYMFYWHSLLWSSTPFSEAKSAVPAASPAASSPLLCLLKQKVPSPMLTCDTMFETTSY